MIRIYASSKYYHGKLWQEWRNKGFPIISTWIDLPPKSPKSPTPTQIGQDHWPVWLEQAKTCTDLILYIKPGDRNHTGCLLEIGAALSGGARVWQIGQSDTFKTLMGSPADFTKHPDWRIVSSLEAAFGRIMKQETAELELI